MQRELSEAEQIGGFAPKQMALPAAHNRGFSSVYFLLHRQVFWPTEDFQQQKAGSNDDAGVGNVEVRVVISEEVERQKVDDVARGKTVVQITNRAAENQRQRNAGHVHSATRLPQYGQHNHNRNHRERDQHPADAVGRRRVGEQAESGAVVVDMRDVEEVRDDDDLLTGVDVAHDPQLTETV